MSYAAHAYGTETYGSGGLFFSDHGMPRCACFISFTTDPGEDPVWEDVTDYLRAFTTSRGRQHELDRFEAGTATVVLDNRDRRFDPTDASGPYYPDVLPLKRIKLTVTWGVEYTVYEGYIEDWPQQWETNIPNEARVTLPCMDGLGVFAAVGVTPFFLELDDAQSGILDQGKLADDDSVVAEDAGSRIGRVLDNVSWPAADRNLDTGISTLMVDQPKGNALDYLRRCEASEAGRFFIAADGTATFLNRHEGVLGDGATSLGTFGDHPTSELPYSNATVSGPITLVRNSIHATRKNGGEQVAEDSSSMAAYYSRSFSETDLLISTDSETLAHAQYIRGRYKDPLTRVSQITINPQRDAARLFPQVLARELGNRITFVRRPPGGGSAITQELVIEHITHTATPETWQTTWDVSAADTTAYFILDTSELDTGVLAY